MDNHFFRSALNGFNRQDVIEYIEKAQREASARVQTLEMQIGSLNAGTEELRSALEGCTQERDASRTQLTQIEQEYAQAKAELESLREQQYVLESELNSARSAQTALSEQLQAMQDEVTAARKEKESVAQLELEARKRAEELLEETRIQAEELLAQARSQAQALLTNANEQSEAAIRAAYERAEEICAATEAHVNRTGDETTALITTVETIVAHVAAELRKMDVAVAQLPINFDRLKDDIKELQQQSADRSMLQE